MSMGVELTASETIRVGRCSPKGGNDQPKGLSVMSSLGVLRMRSPGAHQDDQKR